MRLFVQYDKTKQNEMQAEIKNELRNIFGFDMPEKDQIVPGVSIKLSEKHVIEYLSKRSTEKQRSSRQKHYFIQ